MAYDKVIDSAKLDTAITATADAIRAKTGGTAKLAWNESTGFASDVGGITSGNTIPAERAATASDIVKDKQADVNGELITGTLAETSNQQYLYAEGVSVVVGEMEITAPIESDVLIRKDTPITLIKAMSDFGDASVANVLSGKKFTSSAGYQRTGTMPTQAAQTITPGTTNKTIASGRYLSGTQTIKGDSNLVASNIKSGVSIFGVAGNFAGGGGLAYATGTVTPLTTSTSSSGETIFSVSGLSFTPKFVVLLLSVKFSGLGSKYNIAAVCGGLSGGTVSYDPSFPRLDSETYLSVTMNSNGFVVKTTDSEQHNFGSRYSYIAIGEGGDDE